MKKLVLCVFAVFAVVPIGLQAQDAALSGELKFEVRAGDDHVQDGLIFSEVGSASGSSQTAQLAYMAEGTVYDPNTQQQVYASAFAQATAGYGGDEFTLDLSTSVLRGLARAEGKVDLDIGVIQKRPIPRHLQTVDGDWLDMRNTLYVAPITVNSSRISFEQTGEGGFSFLQFSVVNKQNGVESPGGFLIDGQRPGSMLGPGVHDLTYYVGPGSLTTLRLEGSATSSRTVSHVEQSATKQAVGTVFNVHGQIDQQDFDPKWTELFLAPPPDLNEMFEIYVGGRPQALAGYLNRPAVSVRTSANNRDAKSSFAFRPPATERVESRDGNSFSIARAEAPDPNTPGGEIGVLASASSLSSTDASFKRAYAEATLSEKYHMDAVSPNGQPGQRARVGFNIKFDGKIRLEQLFGLADSRATGKIGFELFARELDGRMSSIFVDTYELEMFENLPLAGRALADEFTEAITIGQGTIVGPVLTQTPSSLAYEYDFLFDVTTSALLLVDNDFTLELRMFADTEANYGGNATVDFLNTASFSAFGIQGESNISFLPQSIPEPSSVMVLLMLAVSVLGRRQRGTS